ncbi:BACON domain-containing protein [Streptantibioticus cattleyicolor]|nr:sigma-70 family RNA polymerase sigma factor [Streptantibioticus cattleyicolor]
MSRHEHTPSHHHATGAHRAVPRATRQAPGGLPPQPAAPDEPYLDGLFTYCLSTLCEHDTAVAALADALAVAERHRGRLRDASLRRAWLYALARWACARHLAPAAPGTAPTAESTAGAAGHATAPLTAGAEARRRELAALAWPEAAGTTPQQRRAVELAVRHQLTEREVAAVLGTDRETARALVSSAACEIERTRIALAVVELGSCPAVARLAGDTHVLLGGTLHRGLVRHVDECPACRFTAEQAMAGGPWPGTATPAVLAVVEAPRAELAAALARSRRALRSTTYERRRGRRAVPRFDRHGFPQDDDERAGRRALFRRRAVTTTVVAAVVAAPALALWAAYRGTPHTADNQEASVSATGSDNGDTYPYPRADRSRPARPRRPGPAGGAPGPASAATADAGPPSPATGTAPPSAAPPGATRPSTAPARLTVTVHPQGADTVLTLTDDGGTPLRWSATTAAPWLRLSATGGELLPGRPVTVLVTVDHQAEPPGPWHARIALQPGATVVTLDGRGHTPAPPPSSSPPSTPPAGPASPAGHPSASGTR